MPIEIRQVRAARELLDWTQARLAKAAGINLSIIKNFESEQRLPTQENFLAIWRAFQKAGVVFEGDRKFLSVKVRRRGHRRYQRPIDPRQSRAARKLLDWSQPYLSRMALVSLGAVRNFEGEHRATAETRLLAILRAFEKAGIVLENAGKVSVVKAKTRVSSSRTELATTVRRAA